MVWSSAHINIIHHPEIRERERESIYEEISSSIRGRTPHHLPLLHIRNVLFAKQKCPTFIARRRTEKENHMYEKKKIWQIMGPKTYAGAQTKRQEL
jgi:hypothetical protein